MSHQTISFVKSVIRILGYLFLWTVAPVPAVVLVISELLGIFEEIGER